MDDVDADIQAIADALGRPVDPSWLARLASRVNGQDAPERELAAELRRRRAATAAALVDLLVGRERAHFDDVADRLYGTREVTERRIRSRCRQANAVAARLTCPVRYWLRSGWLWAERGG